MNSFPATYAPKTNNIPPCILLPSDVYCEEEALRGTDVPQAIPEIGGPMLSLYDLQCEHSTQPIGLPLRSPRFSWKLRSDLPDTLQSSCRLRIFELASDAELPVWDGGTVETGNSVLISTGLVSLKPETCYRWDLTVADNHDATASASSLFETGLGNWEAPLGQWISGDPADVSTEGLASPLIRKSFLLAGEIASARLYATAQGVYELTLNGCRIGDEWMSPGWTSYAKRLQVQVYDVSAQLSEGENVLGASLGNGWFCGNLAWAGNRDLYGKDRALLAELHVRYKDGSSLVVASDGTWKSTGGPVLMSELYHGETCDARLEPAGWNRPGYSDEGWAAVRCIHPSATVLVPQETEPVRIHESLSPIEVITTPEGDTVLDFGQNITGFVRFTVDGPAGAELTLHHAEVLDAAGNFYLANMRSAKNELRYILRGSGPETWNPQFTFQGFRYVRLRAVGFSWKPEQFTACVLHTAMRPTGRFSCSSPLIDQLFHNIIWGQKGNFLDVPTDCPQRDERLGWTGDAQAFIRTACTNFDSARFFTKWLRDLAADQLPSGGVPFVIPAVLPATEESGHSSAAWGDAATICPWTVYRTFGDRQVLADQYSSMKAWVDWITARGGNGLWNVGFHFGDWLGLDAKPDSYVGATPTDLIATAFYAHSTHLVARSAVLLGHEEDSVLYGNLHQHIVRRFRDEFVTPNGRLAAPTQTGYVLALHFDLLEEKDRSRAITELAKLVNEEDPSLTTGFVGTPYLCHVLTRFGRHDLAGKLLLREKYPSWLYPVTKGATTIWEHWDGIREDGSFWSADMNSFNHYAYGAIGDWLFQVVAGIDLDPEIPAYRHIRIRPQPIEGLTCADAEIETPYGPVRTAWTISEGLFTLTVDVPANATAEVLLPGQAEHEKVKIGSGSGQTFTKVV